MAFAALITVHWELTGMLDFLATYAIAIAAIVALHFVGVDIFK